MVVQPVLNLAGRLLSEQVLAILATPQFPGMKTVLANDQSILFAFPGQGSQYVGMGSDLHDKYAIARDVYRQASETLGYDIAKLCFEDPEDKLNLTRYTQPALLTHSYACLQVFRDLTGDRLQPVIAAGHSLGEYSALVAAHVLAFESALKLVQQRGELMGTYGEGEMSAFPMDLDTIRPLAQRHHCAIAGCNLPQQTVIGGRGDDLEKVENEVLETFERKRPVRLKTEGAFHTYYMVKAAQKYRKVLQSAEFSPSSVKVLSNFTGGLHGTDPADIKASLFFQLFHPVMWFANLQQAFENGIDMIFEFGGGIGPGSGPESKRPNLQGMIVKAQRSIGKKAGYQSVINCDSLGKAVDIVAG
ncbi:MAG: ACP S-malonyltransferase [Xanthomonadales bacterium]|nr:ACP S-malonyltransferase [Gammaproteobacteria bacterium]NNK04735.1 ACP S-malonyltransferase [Xanthomonadales bacterium]